jgi:type VI secretion system secreted protein Hcp
MRSAWSLTRAGQRRAGEGPSLLQCVSRVTRFPMTGKGVRMKRIARCIVFFLLAAVAISPATAAIYMKYDGIDGDVTAVGHENWIEILSFSWGVTNDGSGSQANDVSVQQTLNKASPKLLQAALSGSPIEWALMDFVNPNTLDPSTPYLQYKFEDVLISGYSISSGGDLPTESLSLNFTKITFSHRPIGDDGRLGDPVTGGWDFSAGAIPEPSTWVLLAAGLALVVVGRNRMQRRPA